MIVKIATSLHKNEYELAGSIKQSHEISDLDESLLIREASTLLIAASPSTLYGRGASLRAHCDIVGKTTLYRVEAVLHGEARLMDCTPALAKVWLCILINDEGFRLSSRTVEAAQEWLDAEFALAVLSENFDAVSKTVIETASRFILSPSSSKYKFFVRPDVAAKGIVVRANLGGSEECEVVFRP